MCFRTLDKQSKQAALGIFRGQDDDENGNEYHKGHGTVILLQLPYAPASFKHKMDKKQSFYGEKQSLTHQWNIVPKTTGLPKLITTYMCLYTYTRIYSQCGHTVYLASF